jgi:hypothetical protein
VLLPGWHIVASGDQDTDVHVREATEWWIFENIDAVDDCDDDDDDDDVVAGDSIEIAPVDFPDDGDDDNTVDVISPENSMETPGVIGTHPGLNPGVDEELPDEEPPELDEAPNEEIQGHHHLENQGVDDDPDDDDEHLEPMLEQRMDARHGNRSDRYNLRPRKSMWVLHRIQAVAVTAISTLLSTVQLLPLLKCRWKKH